MTCFVSPKNKPRGYVMCLVTRHNRTDENLLLLKEYSFITLYLTGICLSWITNQGKNTGTRAAERSNKKWFDDNKKQTGHRCPQLHYEAYRLLTSIITSSSPDRLIYCWTRVSPIHGHNARSCTVYILQFSTTIPWKKFTMLCLLRVSLN